MQTGIGEWKFPTASPLLLSLVRSSLQATLILTTSLRLYALSSLSLSTLLLSLTTLTRYH